MSLLHIEKEKMLNVISKSWFLQAKIFLAKFHTGTNCRSLVSSNLPEIPKKRRYSLLATTTCWFCGKWEKLKFGLWKFFILQTKQKIFLQHRHIPSQYNLRKKLKHFFFQLKTLLGCFHRNHIQMFDNFCLILSDRNQAALFFNYFNAL